LCTPRNHKKGITFDSRDDHFRFDLIFIKKK